MSKNPIKETVIEHKNTGVVLVEHKEMTDLEANRDRDLYGMVNFFVQAHVYGKIGDILLVPDARLEGLISEHIERYYKPKTEAEIQAAGDTIEARKWRLS
jgi:hypothetical protein